LKKLLLFLLLILGACALVLGFLRKSAPPEVRFTQVKRQTVVSTVPTNGKVEPFEWQAVHAETAGLAARVDVRNGQRVAQGAVLAGISDPEIRAGIDSAEARVSEAQATLQVLQGGGKSAERSDIETSLSRARFNLSSKVPAASPAAALSARKDAPAPEMAMLSSPMVRLKPS